MILSPQFVFESKFDLKMFVAFPNTLVMQEVSNSAGSGVKWSGNKV